MTRQELERKAFENLRDDMQNIGVPNSELWEETKNASDEDLINYLEEC